MQLHLEPEQAFGDYNDQLLFLEPRIAVPDGNRRRHDLRRPACPGVNADMPKDVLYTVSEIYPEHVVLDGNHPLAGIAIRLDMNVK